MDKNVRKKHLSMKNKSAWRKYSEYKDVENFLEEQRQLERIGNLALKKNEELFDVDKEPFSFSVKEKSRKNANRTLNGLLSLKNLSAIEDPVSKRNTVKRKRNGRDILDEIMNPTSKRKVQANKDRKKSYKKLESKSDKQNSFCRDIWAESEPHYNINNQNWISPNTALHNLKNTGRPNVKIPNTILHKTIVKNKEKPDTGISYNPSVRAYENLKKKVLETELKIIKEEKHLKRITTDMFSKVTEEERDLQKLKELNSSVERNDEDNANSDQLEYVSVNPPVIIKKKDRKFRRKQMEQKVVINDIKKKKIENKKISDLNNLKVIEKEVNIEEAKRAKKIKKKIIQMKAMKGKTRRLGKLNFQDPDLDFKNLKELSGNLRSMTPGDTSLLIDRFKLFQKRNILPVSVDVGVRKRKKIKRFVRSSHKDVLQMPMKTK